MSSITLNSNVTSLNAQRRLGQSTSALRNNFTRLSSGLRINRASDDASGLAISTDLKVDARVFNQGVRNVNDSIGLLNIAEGAAQELTGILIRQRELATQASNGTLSSKQRDALNEEANALVSEYNRIVATTEFNDLTLIDGSVESLRVQGGYGESGSIVFAIGEALGRGVGDGTFGDAATYSVANFSRNVDTGDLNNDGFDDVVAGDRQEVFLSNSSGVLTSQGELKPFFNGYDQAIVDVNNDSKLDVVALDSTNNRVNIYLGVGDGTFGAAVTYADGADSRSLEVGDLNGDGAIDIVTTTYTDDRINISLGNGDGTFKARTSISVAPGVLTLLADGIKLSDIDGDNDLDIVTAYDGVPDSLVVLEGDGTGNFAAAVSYVGSAVQAISSIELGDIDGDGAIDALVSIGPEVNLFLGNGDGTFKARSVLLSGLGLSRDLVLDDLNGDGFEDIALTEQLSDAVRVYLSNGDGTFAFDASYDASNNVFGIATGDLNGDGAQELVTVENGGSAELQVLLGNFSQVNTIAELDLTTQQGAREAMDVIDAQLVRVNQELGGIGATQSRLATAVSNLGVARENYITAASQITDVDVAEEAARLVRSQILQQAGAAVLSQANQAPQLALLLLGS